MRRFLLAFAVAALAAAESRFEWRDRGSGQLELLEDGRPALVYNYGPQLKAGAPEDRRRCCYIYPLYTPAGVSMLDDFPKDHWHHRGLFWAWPVVEAGGRKYDLWISGNLKHRLQRVLAKRADTEHARLLVENGWYAGEQKIVRETVRLTVHPAAGNARNVDVELRLEAVGGPVTLRGSQETGKSYGGFSARFAPRKATVLRADDHVVAADEDLVPHRWAELEAEYDGRRAALRIAPDPENLGMPYQWCLRNYGFVGASFPGRTESIQGYMLKPGRPLVLRFRVRAADVRPEE